MQGKPVLARRRRGWGRSDHPAIDHLLALSDDAGWRCRCGPELGRFRGPGRKTDPCPIANVCALKALSLVPEYLDSPATRRGTEMLLGHWARRTEVKYYLFGVGGDYRKLKYPFVWYDILHVAEVLSRYPFVRADPCFGEMLAAITAQADPTGATLPGRCTRRGGAGPLRTSGGRHPGLRFWCCVFSSGSTLPVAGSRPPDAVEAVGRAFLRLDAGKAGW